MINHFLEELEENDSEDHNTFHLVLCTFHLVHNFEEIAWGIMRLFFYEFHGTFFCYNLIVASLNLLGNISRHNTKIICTLYFG